MGCIAVKTRNCGSLGAHEPKEDRPALPMCTPAHARMYQPTHTYVLTRTHEHTRTHRAAIHHILDFHLSSHPLERTSTPYSVIKRDATTSNWKLGEVGVLKRECVRARACAGLSASEVNITERERATAQDDEDKRGGGMKRGSGGCKCQRRQASGRWAGLPEARYGMRPRH